MKVFSGFPSGKVEVTPLPNLFFSELCPDIDDLAELKLTLHVMWLIAHRKAGAPPCVSTDALRADETLMRSLAAAGPEPEQALPRALAQAAERGTLLRQETVDGGLYYVNNPAGRHAYERGKGADRARGATREPASAARRPNIFTLYEQNIGLLTPMIAEELKLAEEEYPAEWVAEAFKAAVEHNARNWKYVKAILTRWKTEGRGDRSKGKAWYGDELSKFVKR